jgi:hypothetical protein
MERGAGSTSKANGLWKYAHIFAQDFMTTLGTLTLKEKDEIETKFDKAH